MDTKFVIFVLISTFLVTVIYSSTATHYVSATVEYDRACMKHTTFGHNLQTCCYFATDDKGNKIYTESCYTQDCGAKGLNCVFPREYASHLSGNDIGTLSGGDNNTSNGNVKEPKAPKLPEDLGSLVHEGR